MTENLNHFSRKKFVWSCLSDCKLGIAVMFLVSLMWASYVIGAPYILKILLDRASQARDLKLLIFPALGLLGAQFVMWTMTRVYDYFVIYKMIPKLKLTVSKSVLESLQSHSLSFFQKHLSGSIVGRVDELSRVIPELLMIVIDKFFTNMLMFIMAISAFWTVSPLVASSLAIWVIVFGAIYYLYFYPRIVHACEEWSYADVEKLGIFNDFFSNILTVKLFSTVKQENKTLNVAMDEVKRKEEKFRWNIFLSYIFYGYSFFLYQIVCLIYLVKTYSMGLLTTGDFAFIMMVNIQFADYVWQLTSHILHFTEHLGTFKQACIYLKSPREVIDKPHALPLSLTHGKITFKNVSFYYDEATPLFNNINLTIDSGKKIGLAGYSGAGKSSFVSLVLRLFDVQKGQILIDNQDISQVAQKSIRESIGYIPQDPTLFHRTIYENIAYGKQNCTYEEVIEASKKAQAHDFIMRLAYQYETYVGERGIKLSAGQRQRIAIARTFLKNAPILFLDEATSQVDLITEAYIQQVLNDLMKNKTTLVIAHRLSTLINMDRILVFDKGKIVQDGTHLELMNKTGLYRDLLSGVIVKSDNARISQKKASQA